MPHRTYFVRAVIHDGRELELQAEAGYIDARPLAAQVVEIFLQRTAGPYIGSVAAFPNALAPQPLCPE
jgi:hypothetical protein